MCQLTYANLHDPYLNSLAVYLLGKIGSDKHDDGCGFICPDNKIWKTELAANKITNLGEILNFNITDDRAIPFHIRSATWGIAVNKVNSHPFIGKHFILMHNGTLLPKDGEEPKDKTNDSDSLKFLNALDECKDINPKATFEELFNAAMGNFCGKFAFIIREIETNLDYIIRGKTAELWISEFTYNKEKQGYLINTSKDTLNDAFLEFINIWNIFYKDDVSFSKPVILEQESIFLANDLEIIKIGDAKETIPPKKEYNYVARTNNHWESGTNYFDDDDKDMKDIIDKASKIYDFLDSHNMGLSDFQLMVMISGGLSLLEMTKEDVEMYIDYIIPKISVSKKIREEVNTILEGGYFPIEVYEKYELEYPWTVNDGKKVIDSLKDYFKKEK